MKSKAQLAFDLVCQSFGGNVHRTNCWFHTYNSELKCAPVGLLKQGKIDELLEWVKGQLIKGEDKVEGHKNENKGICRKF